MPNLRARAGARILLVTASLAILTAGTIRVIPVAGAAARTSPSSAVSCDFADYKPAPGLKAFNSPQNTLTFSWDGQAGTELRAEFAIVDGQPIVRTFELSKVPSGQWTQLGRNLLPEYHVTSGVRRMADDQGRALDGLGIQITQEVIDKHRWFAFWDAPLVVPGTSASQNQTGRGQLPVPAGRVYGLPRTPQEIRRAIATFKSDSCAVKTDGSSLAVTFPGLSMGIFEGSLRFTVYRGTNLFQMDAIAKTDQPWVAYKYDAGLKGFSTSLTPVVKWHDTGGRPQQYRFGGPVSAAMSGLRAANRIILAEGRGASLAAFTPPHTFFFTREKDTNLGYVWYRKDSDATFGMGIRMPEAEEDPQYALNFALYNAPPGSWQHMTVFFHAWMDSAEPSRQAALAFTHDDAFKPISGYKTFVNHFHLAFTDRQRAQGFDTPLQDLVAMKALGLNIVGLSDFHFELHATDPGPMRFPDERDYFEASRRASDGGFLVAPWEEPSVFFGGHYNILFPKNVYWSKVRRAGQPFTETDAAYGKVYHTGSAADLQQLMDAEGGYWYTAHPRTKSSAGYPDAYVDREWARNDRYLGVAFKPGMGMDLSENTLCAYRCFDAVDTMNNLYAGSGLRPKYVIADIDTYRKGPEDDLYPNFPVNYLKLDRVPAPDEDWGPVLRAMRDGKFFVTTGEILIKNYAVSGTGAKRTISADAEWTFPLAFLEIVWGDGKNVGRKILPVTDLPPFGSKRFSLDFDAAGKAWVRFAIWDAAGDGAFVQPVWLGK